MNGIAHTIGQSKINGRHFTFSNVSAEWENLDRRTACGQNEGDEQLTFGHHAIVIEDQNDANFKFDLEVRGQQRRTCECSRESHPDRDGHFASDVTVANLNILNFRRCRQKSVRVGSRENDAVPSRENPSAHPHVSIRSS